MLMMFRLNVFYLPTLKQVVGHYKSCNEVMFWFTQMMCYNVYIPLLIRQANDVEENPGSTIFDIIDPTTFVSADSSQGNEAIFGVNAGKQCVAMSLMHLSMLSCWGGNSDQFFCSNARPQGSHPG